MDTLNIPIGLKVTFAPYPEFDAATCGKCTRIEVIIPGVGEEVAYWYADGTNDIMRGETGTVIEAAQALIDFTIS